MRIAWRIRKLRHLPWAVSRIIALIDAQQDRDWGRARELLISLHKAGFSSASTHVDLGYCNAQLEQWDEAVAAFSRARPEKLRRTSDIETYYMWYAYALDSLGDHDQAVAHLDRYATLCPSGQDWAARYLDPEQCEPRPAPVSSPSSKLH
jgi:tetratricopeptide (TPR) repeat protein